MPETKLDEMSFFDRVRPFLTDYFIRSPNYWKARIFLTACVFLSLSSVGLGFVLGWWCFPFLYAAFVAKNMSLLLVGMGAGLGIIAAIVGLNFLSHYFKNKVLVDWRSWLQKEFINDYLSEDNNHKFVKLAERHPEINNIDQIIQENTENFVDASLSLTVGFVENFSKLILYVVLLALVGGSLSFMALGTTIVVPQFLLLTAMLVGLITTGIGYQISKSLQTATNEEIKVKSAVRKGLNQVSQQAKELAMENGGPFVKDKLQQCIEELNEKTNVQLWIKNKIISFNYFVSLIQQVITFLAAAPLYFNDLITLDMFSSVGYYFAMISSSLNWFAKSFDIMNTFKTSFKQLEHLKAILKQVDSTEIQRNISENGNVLIKNLEIRAPQSDLALLPQ
jgi:putative ATP-binding cassette transporter